MFDCGFDIRGSFQFTAEEHYFLIEERDLVVAKGTGKLDMMVG